MKEDGNHRHLGNEWICSREIFVMGKRRRSEASWENFEDGQTVLARRMRSLGVGDMPLFSFIIDGVYPYLCSFERVGDLRWFLRTFY
jgi:hypothetical protein